MDSRAIILRAVAGKKLKRNEAYRVIPWGDGLCFTIPTKHRPTLKIYATPLQRQIWEIFKEPSTIGAVFGCTENQRNPIFDKWELLWSLADMERKHILVPVRRQASAGIRWPNWKEKA